MNRSLVLVAAGVLVLAACGGGSDSEDAADDPPTASATTMAGMGAGGEHSDHGGSPPGTCSPAGTTVSVVASATKFNTDCLAAPADQAFSISYDNRDTIGHNIAILESHTATEVLYRAEILPGPKMSMFEVPALKPGSYVFHCEVHPSQMLGAFVVK